MRGLAGLLLAAALLTFTAPASARAGDCHVKRVGGVVVPLGLKSFVSDGELYMQAVNAEAPSPEGCRYVLKTQFGCVAEAACTSEEWEYPVSLGFTPEIPQGEERCYTLWQTNSHGVPGGRFSNRLCLTPLPEERLG